MKLMKLMVATFFCAAALIPAVHGQTTTGGLRGTVRDPNGALIAGAQVALTRMGTNVVRTTNTNESGDYAFVAVPVGVYQIEITASGFKPFKRSNVVVDINSALQINATLEVSAPSETVIVTEGGGAEVKTTDTQLGQVINAKQITDVPLNGRSYTDLLALQTGVTPLTTSGATNSTSGGGFGTVPIAGNENTGQFSINGQRESANGFFLNGISVQEAIGNQAGIIPNLDSIAEFRILTGGFDAEYGNYSGGLVNVVTKSGANDFHGSAFEFLRNTAFDARGFFSPERSTFQQNQFGGTIGGRIIKDKLFFFGDYQGQRTVQGIETGIVSVPSLANRNGDFSDAAASLTGTVGGAYQAQILAQRLGYPVTVGEPFYTPGCTTTTQCVFPNALIPTRAFALPAKRMLKYIPSPNLGASQFSSGAEKKRINDNKGSARIDFNSPRLGNVSAYYFYDRYRLDDPYPKGFGGATVPYDGGVFNALSFGTTQSISLSHIKSIGATWVNEARVGYTRLNNSLGKPRGGVGVTLAEQGIASDETGIQQGRPAEAGVEVLYFNSFTIGTNPFSILQVNNTFQASDGLTKITGDHTLKFGGQYILYLVKQDPNLVANGTFSFFGNGSQSTGNGFADFLLGFPDFYSQQSTPAFYERATTAALYAQDSWRVSPNLTLNYGLRWDYITPWSEKHNQTTTFVLGVQSQTFPGAPLGYLVPGDPLPDGSRLPKTIAPTPLDNFSPRLGIAYSPDWKQKFLRKITGGAGRSSIRLGAGRFFTSPEGLTVAYPTGNPPYGLTYTSPEAPLMERPFIGALTGTRYIQQFPVNVPSYNVSPANPDRRDFSRYTPISGAGSVWYKNKTPYTMSLHLTFERQIGGSIVLSAGYVGSLSRHLLLVHSANPGDPALCLSLSRPEDVAPGTPTCGPFGENLTYIRRDGTVVRGTRKPFPNEIGTNAYYENMGNANYNALQLTLRRTRGRLSFMASYTYGKSLDMSSSIQEQADPYNFRKLYAISAFDIKHNFVVSYNYDLPLDHLLGRNRLTEGWAISGITRLATGLPVTFASFGDNYLVYVQNNGVNSVSIDMTDCLPGDLQINNNPRNGRPQFNTTLFRPNALGTPGTCSRRFFYGPGINNTDLVLKKSTRLGEDKMLELRFEAFNAFNHAQFFGNNAVDGNIDSPTFGHIVKAASPRIVQLGIKFKF
jgi:hypothetical protein